MKGIDPAVWTQLILAFAAALGGLGAWLKANANGKKSDINAAKIDANTAITQAAHAETTQKISELSTKVEGQANVQNTSPAGVSPVSASHDSGSAP